MRKTTQLGATLRLISERIMQMMLGFFFFFLNACFNLGCCCGIQISNLALMKRGKSGEKSERKVKDREENRDVTSTVKLGLKPVVTLSRKSQKVEDVHSDTPRSDRPSKLTRRAAHRTKKSAKPLKCHPEVSSLLLHQFNFHGRENRESWSPNLSLTKVLLIQKAPQTLRINGRNLTMS